MEHRNLLLAELAALDQQIANLEALAAIKSDNETERRTNELLAEARAMQQAVEERLRQA